MTKRPPNGSDFVRVLNVAARLVTTRHRHWLRLLRGWPWTDLITSDHARLRAPT